VRLGGGATVTGKPAGTAISSSGFASDKQWYVDGYHLGINSKNETLTAWAVCTEKVGKVSDASHVANAGSPPTGNHATVECVQGHAVGGGVEMVGNASDWWLNSTSGIDTGDADEDPDDGWVAWVNHPSGASDTFITEVVCMEGKQSEYRQKQKETDKKNVAVKVFCPKGTSVTGGGAFASGATDESHVMATAPIDSKKDSDSVPDDGWKAKIYNDVASDQDFTAHVVCK
jgi:hypothetical protein